MERQEGLSRFYEILEHLRIRVGGFKRLADAHGRMDWPNRGVYFFFEAGEVREDGQTLRVVRVGTHAVSRNSQTTLWGRLRQHRGSLRGRFAGGGNERGSVFRNLIGDALFLSGRLPPEAVVDSWNTGQTASAEVRRAEHALELAVSDHIRAMPFLWIAVDDSPGPQSIRQAVERNAIALLSNFKRESIDPPSRTWLGLNSSQPKVRQSGLWNVNHVQENFEPNFLEQLRDFVF